LSIAAIIDKWRKLWHSGTLLAWVFSGLLKAGNESVKLVPDFQFLELRLENCSCDGLTCKKLMLASDLKVGRSLISSRVQYLVAMLCLLLIATPVVADTADAEKAYDDGDYLEALNLWLPLAEAGDTTAQYNIATLYRLGRGVPADPSVSVNWYLRAAQHGHARSQVSLGRLYLDGTGVKRDVSQALIWFQKAADSGDVFGQYFLGRQYVKGIGVPQNYRQAASFFRSSAEQGLRDSAYELAVLYTRGEGVEFDQSEAVKWFGAAAHAGHVRSQFSMGVIYEEGRGVPVDLGRAYLWYSMAGARGHETGERNRNRLAPELSVQQLNEVRRSLREWRNRIP